MEIPAVELVKLLSRLWNNEFPLTQKYFGKSLHKLIEADINREIIEPDFLLAGFNPEKLESRLGGIQNHGIIKNILREVSLNQSPNELDRRLVDAWAEIRVVTQLQKEGFINIDKVVEVGDLTAEKERGKFVFQVTRIGKLISQEVARRNPPEKRDASPFGELEDIYSRFGEDDTSDVIDSPLSYYFWDAIERKNNSLKHWSQEGFCRCIVIVGSDTDLQDNLIRHIACREIRRYIHELPNIYFEQLLWLPDTGNGALFIIGESIRDTACFAAWRDNPVASHINNVSVARIKVGLDNYLPG